jgi:hypothetical protein
MRRIQGTFAQFREFLHNIVWKTSSNTSREKDTDRKAVKYVAREKYTDPKGSHEARKVQQEAVRHEEQAPA